MTPSSASAPGRWATTRYKEERAELLADTSVGGLAFCQAYAALVDRWLVELLGDEEDVALLAVGGYGRAELCPSSDIDVLLVHRGRRDIAAIADRLWYPLWDAGLTLGHGVRTAKEAVALADGELEIATSMLTARPVAGDPTLAAEVIQRSGEHWRKRGSRWLATLSRSVEERHQRAGEVAFLLEPELKEGRGGLRDVHAIEWAEVTRQMLLPNGGEAVAHAYRTILAVRVALHRHTGRPGDQLLLQDQDAVAEALGDVDADALMGRLSAAARVIAWTSDETWWRVAAALAGPSGRVVSRDRRLAEGVVSRDGVVELDRDADPAADPALVLRVAAAAATAGARISATALDRLAAAAPPLGGPWPPGALDALVEVLLAGRAAIPVLEALDQKGLLVRILPEWEAV
ncbi:MAG: [protein-PII] uridylyltransferase, partial [Acidimicrobiaceae bacterium]|nr:[protein-PII] uridylyltransferase [Acidimicrobiaceae bacterium]